MAFWGQIAKPLYQCLLRREACLASHSAYARGHAPSTFSTHMLPQTSYDYDITYKALSFDVCLVFRPSSLLNLGDAYSHKLENVS